MPGPKTEVTEITTGLALLGFPDIERALDTRPTWFINVVDKQYDQLIEARKHHQYDDDFEIAWATGKKFLNSRDGLRGRVPDRLEWKGPGKPPGYELIPADLQVDHVYLISCKFGSDIILNASPPHLFDRLLAERRGAKLDWYEQVALTEYQTFYSACVAHYGVSDVPDDVSSLTAEDRLHLKNVLPKGGRWDAEVLPIYQDFVNAVSAQSAEHWLGGLADKGDREEMVWRLLRFQPAPYFVLGNSADGTPLAFRVGTPSELRQDYDFIGFDCWNPVAGQPSVAWRADFKDRASGERSVVNGHVEVRWSRGRFGGFPEAKVYLDTPHHEVPGYVALA